MIPVSIRVVFSIFLLGFACTVAAADSALGVVTANGDFLLNGARVSGNATLFRGSEIETGRTSSRLHMHQGARIELGANSKAKVLDNRLVLESGTGDLASPGDFQIQAGTFRIAPTTAESAARVARDGREVVQVAALRGSLRVYDSSGLQIANVIPGMALAFEAQVGGAAPPSSFLGCVLKKADKYVLYDQTTRIVIELRGNQDFAAERGNRVQAIGTTDTSAESDIAAQVVDVTSITRFARGGCDSVATAIGADLPGAATAAAAETVATTPLAPAVGGGIAPTGGAMSAGTKIAILAAVGGGAGVAAAVAASGGDSRSQD